jgi:nitrite reductase/ring-hydroxylating ferredoxin subunit
MSYDYQVNPAAPPDSLEARQAPVDNGLEIPDPSRYFSEEFMRKEWTHLWPRAWLLAGVTADVREPGDYFTFDIGHESIIVARQDDGSLKAFYNVCPHRANRIALNDFGSVNEFTCAFHGWKFRCNGQLKSITDEQTFAPKLVAHRPGMSEVRCDSHAGLIFVNLDGKAPPLAEWIGLPKGYLENYRIDEMNAVRHVRTLWNANWKVGVDSFYETYHLPHIHPQTQTVMGDFSQYDLYPNGFSRMIVPLCQKSHRVPDQDSVDAGLRFMMQDAGMDPDSYKGDARGVRAAVQRSKRERARRLGLTHYDNFTDGQLTDSWATGLFPNVQIGCHPEGVFIMRRSFTTTTSRCFVTSTIRITSCRLGWAYRREPTSRVRPARPSSDLPRGSAQISAKCSIRTSNSSQRSAPAADRAASVVRFGASKSREFVTSIASSIATSRARSKRFL